MSKIFSADMKTAIGIARQTMNAFKGMGINTRVGLITMAVMVESMAHVTPEGFGFEQWFYDVRLQVRDHIKTLMAQDAKAKDFGPN